MKPKHVILSRPDSIGDVMLTLPLAGLLKQSFPDVRISFLGMPYTRDIIKSCAHVDEFIDWHDLKELNEEDSAKQLWAIGADLIIHVFPCRQISRLAVKAGIPNRLGSTGRWYHWLHCNILVSLSRRNSAFHEAILNIKLAAPVLKKTELEGVQFRLPTTVEIPMLYGFTAPKLIDHSVAGLIDHDYVNVILHPRSKGSAREWGLNKYADLTRRLTENAHGINGRKFKVFITGTRVEGDMLHKEGFFELAGNVSDVTGMFSLSQFIEFIDSSDVLVAGSTGPLHIASALGKIAVGLYPPIKPMHPGRWAPLGTNAAYIVKDIECEKCRKLNECECMKSITVDQVQQKIVAMVLNTNLKK